MESNDTNREEHRAAPTDSTTLEPFAPPSSKCPSVTRSRHDNTTAQRIITGLFRAVNATEDDPLWRRGRLAQKDCWPLPSGRYCRCASYGEPLTRVRALSHER